MVSRTMRLAANANVGAAGGDRTHDPWLRRPILYPLSYSRVEGTVKWHEGYLFSAFPSMQSHGFPFQIDCFTSIIEGLAGQRIHQVKCLQAMLGSACRF